MISSTTTGPDLAGYATSQEASVCLNAQLRVSGLGCRNGVCRARA